MTDITKAITAAREALALLREHDGGTRYNGDDYDVGTRACCGVTSYKPHDSDCPHAVAVAEFDRLLAALDAAQPVAWYRPSEEGYDSAFRDAATVARCDGHDWAGWVPLYLAPQAPSVEWFERWIRNNYQNHCNIAGLCDAMSEAAYGITKEQAPPAAVANVTPMRQPRLDLARLVDAISAAVYANGDGLSVTEAIGALEIAKLGLLKEQEQ